MASDRLRNHSRSAFSGSLRAALAGCVLLALQACGGGGGSNVKGSPPPANPGGLPEETSVYVRTGTTLTVKSGESVTKPIVMSAYSTLDNAGSIGGNGVADAVSSAQEASIGGDQISNHDGGIIDGGRFAFFMSSATITNAGAGSVIRGGDVGANVFSLTLRNSNGALVTGGDSGVRALDGRVTNSDGGIIRGGRVGIQLSNEGEIHNGAGSTIETTGSTTGDCSAGGSCAILALPGRERSLTLENAGSIIGNVQLDPTAYNKVILWAGGSITGDLAINQLDHLWASSLTLDGGPGTSQRYSQAVTGATMFHGTWIKQGMGTWILDTEAAAGADFWIKGGTLQVGEGGTEGSTRLGAVTIDDGRLVFNRSDDVVVDFGISGGVLEHAGTGLLTLAPAQGISALVRNDAGRRMQVGIDDGDSRCCVWLASSIVNDGLLTFGGSYQIRVTGGVSGAGSLVQDGVGRTSIYEENTYSGGTTIQRGTLQALKGLPGDVVVRSNGILGGPFQESDSRLPVSGLPRVEGSVSSDGRVAVGRGDTQVGGDYRQSTSGTLAVWLGSKLAVAGTATLEGGALEVAGAEDGYIGNSRTEVLTAGGGIVGAFDRLVKAPGVVFTSTTIHYDPTSVWLDTRGLDITRAASGDGIVYTAASMNSAERVQGAFEQINHSMATDALAGVSSDFLHAAGNFQRAPSIEAAQASLRSLAGQMHAASAAITFRAIDEGNQAFSDHLERARASRKAGMWTQRMRGDGLLARDGFDGIGFRSNGWMVGQDYRFGDSGLAGFAFGQGVGSQQLRNGGENDFSRRSEVSLYAALAGDRWYTQGRFGVGQFHRDIDRRLLLGRMSEAVWTGYDGRYQVAYGEAGFGFGPRGLRIAPFMAVEYSRSDRDAFSERGAGGFGLRSDAQGVERWQAAWGMRVGRHWNLGPGRAVDFGASARWRRTLASAGEVANASFVGIEEWLPLAGIGASRHGTVIGLGLDAQLSPRATLKLSYDYENGEYGSAQGVSTGLSVAF